MVIAVGKHQRNSSKRGLKRSNRKKKRDSKGPNLDDDDSHPSKDFFEPDEISITSAPHGGRLSAQILENDG